MYSTLIENFVEPIYDLVRGTSRFRCRRILENTQYLPMREIEHLQSHNLRALISHSYKTVPYYHRLFREAKVKPGDIQTVQDLRKLPVLKKPDIRANFRELISKNFREDQLIPYETGGTGSPLKFFITKGNISWEVAAEYRAYKWANYTLGDRCFIFWGSHRDLHVNLAKKAASRLQRITAVEPFLLSDEVLNGFADMMDRSRPEVIRGYATPVYMMARFLLKERIESIRPRAVITHAEMLLPQMRRTIENAFGCQVFDFYGTREIGAISSECEAHNGYHISSENVVMEFVRDGETVQSEQGKILLTNLRNYGMPLIRYENGDVGEPANEPCSCGRGLPLMKAIKGRASQFFGLRDGKTGKIVPYDASVIWDHFMTFLESPPENYRVIQESVDHIVIKAVRGTHYSERDTERLVDELRRCLGQNITIEIDFVSALPPLPSGKRSPLISKVEVF